VTGSDARLGWVGTSRVSHWTHMSPQTYSSLVNVAQVGLDVARLRRRAGLSQAELARRAGTTQAVISRLENGLKLPGYGVMDRIADALATNVTVTFGTAEPLPSRDERRRRVRAVLGDYVFDPWARGPAPAEARSLEADGLTRERFSRR